MANSFNPSSSIPVSLTMEQMRKSSSSPASFLAWRMRASPRTNGQPGLRTTNTSVPKESELDEVSTSRPVKTSVSSTRGSLPNLTETSVASCRSCVFIVSGIMLDRQGSSLNGWLTFATCGIFTFGRAGRGGLRTSGSRISERFF